MVKGFMMKKHEDFDSKRPDHPDFMTSFELQKTKFSGLRHNSISHELEIWVDGEIRKRLTQAELQYDSDLAIANAFKEVFRLDFVDVAIEDNKYVSPIIHRNM